MAKNDYRRCDICGGKTFYDANLQYEWPDDDGLTEPIKQEELVRGKDYKLMLLGDWAVLCQNCAKTHKVVIVPIESSDRPFA